MLVKGLEPPREVRSDIKRMVVVPPEARIVVPIDVIVIVGEAGEFLRSLSFSFSADVPSLEDVSTFGRVTRRRPPLGGYPLVRI